MSETCLIFFRAGNADLETASECLTRTGIAVTREGDHLVATRSGAPRFTIYLNTQPWVREEAAGIAGEARARVGLRECDARFEVIIPDLDRALDEANTLIEIQGELQEVSNGYLFLSWNGELVQPPTN